MARERLEAVSQLFVTYYYDHQATDGSETGSLNIRGSKARNAEGSHSERVKYRREVAKFLVLRLCSSSSSSSGVNKISFPDMEFALYGTVRASIQPRLREVVWKDILFTITLEFFKADMYLRLLLLRFLLLFQDPKEYVPFLNSLRHMSSFDKYTIDMYLRRHSRALSNISECG